MSVELQFSCFSKWKLESRDVGTHLFCETAGFIVWSRFLDAAAKLRALSI